MCTAQCSELLVGKKDVKGPVLPPCPNTAMARASCNHTEATGTGAAAAAGFAGEAPAEDNDVQRSVLPVGLVTVVE